MLTKPPVIIVEGKIGQHATYFDHVLQNARRAQLIQRAPIMACQSLGIILMLPTLMSVSFFAMFIHILPPILANQSGMTGAGCRSILSQLASSSLERHRRFRHCIFNFNAERRAERSKQLIITDHDGEIDQHLVAQRLLERTD